MLAHSFDPGSFADSRAPILLSAGESPTGDAVVVPPGVNLATAAFERVGRDLLITARDGGQLVVQDYFGSDHPRDLIASASRTIRGEIVEQLSGGLSPGQYAQADAEPAPTSIGRVETAVDAVAIHADGSRTVLNPGDMVFAGDIVETGMAGAVGIVFVDETTLSLANDGRLLLDEMVYDPSTQDGEMGVELVHGMLSFVSGQIAKTSPDAMSIKTQVATIGIRGTKGVIDLPEGESLTVALTVDPGGRTGEIVVTNGAGVQVLNLPFQATRVLDAALPPSSAFTMSAEEFNANYARALSVLPAPTHNQGGNDAGGGTEDGGGEETGGDGTAPGTDGDAPADDGGANLSPDSPLPGTFQPASLEPPAPIVQTPTLVTTPAPQTTTNPGATTATESEGLRHTSRQRRPC